jgi:hypothetical protein
MRKHNVIVIIVAIAMGGGAAYLARSWLQNECLSRLSPTRSYCDRGGAPGVRRDCDFRERQRGAMVHECGARGRLCD